MDLAEVSGREAGGEKFEEFRLRSGGEGLHELSTCANLAQVSNDPPVRAHLLRHPTMTERQSYESQFHRYKQWRDRDEMPTGEAREHGHGAVSLEQEELRRISRELIAMNDDRFRHVDDLEAPSVHSDTQFGILVVREEVLVEPS